MVRRRNVFKLTHTYMCLCARRALWQTILTVCRTNWQKADCCCKYIIITNHHDCNKQQARYNQFPNTHGPDKMYVFNPPAFRKKKYSSSGAAMSANNGLWAASQPEGLQRGMELGLSPTRHSLKASRFNPPTYSPLPTYINFWTSRAALQVLMAKG
jgi:hypothetical protein